MASRRDPPGQAKRLAGTARRQPKARRRDPSRCRWTLAEFQDPGSPALGQEPHPVRTLVYELVQETPARDEAEVAAPGVEATVGSAVPAPRSGDAPNRQRTPTHAETELAVRVHAYTFPAEANAQSWLAVMADQVTTDADVDAIDAVRARLAERHPQEVVKELVRTAFVNVLLGHKSTPLAGRRQRAARRDCRAAAP